MHGQNHIKYVVYVRKVNRVNRKRPTPWSEVLPEKLTVTELLKKFPATYDIQRLLTTPTRASHWLLT